MKVVQLIFSENGNEYGQESHYIQKAEEEGWEQSGVFLKRELGEFDVGKVSVEENIFLSININVDELRTNEDVRSDVSIAFEKIGALKDFSPDVFIVCGNVLCDAFCALECQNKMPRTTPVVFTACDSDVIIHDRGLDAPSLVNVLWFWLPSISEVSKYTALALARKIDVQGHVNEKVRIGLLLAYKGNNRKYSELAKEEFSRIIECRIGATHVKVIPIYVDIDNHANGGKVEFHADGCNGDELGDAASREELSNVQYLFIASNEITNSLIQEICNTAKRCKCIYSVETITKVDHELIKETGKEFHYVSYSVKQDDGKDCDGGVFSFFGRELVKWLWTRYDSRGSFLQSLKTTQYHSIGSGDNVLISDSGQLLFPLSDIVYGANNSSELIDGDSEACSIEAMALLLQQADMVLRKFDVSKFRINGVDEYYSLRDFVKESTLEEFAQLNGAVSHFLFDEDRERCEEIDPPEYYFCQDKYKICSDRLQPWWVTLLQSMNRDTPLQVNLKEDDVEDNGAIRVYLSLKDCNAKGCTTSQVVSLRMFLYNQDVNADKVIIEKLILAKTEFEARNGRGCVISCDEEINGIKGINLISECVKQVRNLIRQRDCSEKLYIIPEVFDSLKGRALGGMAFQTNKKLNILELQLLSNIVTRIADPIHRAFYLRGLNISNTKSAIGSIMSRNGSHNIGSHVLAALSHNVGTMPDDRVLYQYIQQRMDYIATATTDFPAWRQPTMLVSGMLREFLIQRHLLDHIAGSEGLHAYQFQNRSLAPNQNNTIRIHIRRIKDDVKNWVNYGFLSCVNGEIVDDNSCVVPFINYRSESGAYSALKDNKDIAVAIPGGVVGQHAFYTILENIVRNAAKHDWAKADKADSKYANLELYIDFRDNPKEGLVEFRVWTCVIGFKQKVGTTIVHAKRIGIGNSGESVLNEITKKVCQCFIDADGGLRKENWGIAEMRISAGYLRNCDIADIGGLNNCGVVDNDCETIKIIRPVNVSLPDATEALGYRFDLYKPRELLVVLPESCNCSSSVLECANQNANQYGVWVKRECDLVKEVNLSFSYVLFDVFDINNEYRQCLPFRVIATKIVSREIKAINDSDDSKKGGGCLSSAKRLIPEIGSPIFKYIGSVDDLSDVDKLAKDERTAKVLCESLLERVYGIWVSHVAKDKIATENPALAIYVAGGGNEKKSLVTKFDLLRFVLENSFNAAAKSFLDIGLAANVPNSTTGSVAVDEQNSGELKSNALFTKVLNGIIALKPRDVSVSFNEGSESPGQSLKLLALSDVLRRQIQSWFCALYGMTTDSLKCYKEFTSSKAYKAFISYICGPILSQAEVFLSKYEEDYSTLPLDFKIEVDKNDECVPQPYIYCGKQKVEVEYSNDDKQCLMRYDEGYMCYLRHSPGLGGDIGNYLEPLSGSQSYLGAFIALRDNLLDNVTSTNDKRFVVSLVENAAMRILIIDERVKDFMDNHNEVRRKLGGLGIAVMDDDDSEVINLFDAINIDGGGGRLDDALSVHVSGVALKDFEVLIIHQGIIDKLLNGHENVEEVREFLKALISRMKYVVVATGRGSPANIPDEARVLPYSVIKDTLLKCYPEKMILVGAVMNILSVRNTKGG